MQVSSSTVAVDRRARFRLVPTAGFTLVELLTVILLMAILASIALGAIAGLQARAYRQRAKADLAVIARSIEAFRRYYGSYPQTDQADELYAALAGYRSPRNQPLPVRCRRFLDPAGLSLAHADADDPANRVLDPWGRPYAYAYSPSPLWALSGYLLYSQGPDGISGGHEDGFPDSSSPGQADNLYVNQ